MGGPSCSFVAIRTRADVPCVPKQAEGSEDRSEEEGLQRLRRSRANVCEVEEWAVALFNSESMDLGSSLRLWRSCGATRTIALRGRRRRTTDKR